MAKFCAKCGSRLDEATGLCPKCDAEKLAKASAKFENEAKKQEANAVQNRPLSKKDMKKQEKADKKAAKKARKKEKLAKLTTGQKVGRFFLKLLLWLILLAVIAGGVIGTLSYFDVVDIQLFSSFKKDNLLRVVNEKRIVVKKTNIVLETETEGKATIIVQMPDYELLFKEAYSSDDPDQYLLKALILKKYDIKEYERTALVTVDDGKTTVHSDEVVHQLLEEVLINAINALSEVE